MEEVFFFLIMGYGLAITVPKKKSTSRLNSLKNHITQCPKDDVIPNSNLKLKEISPSLTYLQVNKSDKIWMPKDNSIRLLTVWQ